MARVHFISGLPRSGSTLLSALLRQNPRFTASMTSPVGSLCSAVLPHMSGTSEFASFFADEKRCDILRGLFRSYYGDAPGVTVIFDSNRRWTTRLPLLQTLFPDSRVICCVRDIGWILDSLERAIRKHPAQVSRLFSEKTGKTVYSRVQAHMEPETGLVGLAWSALREAWFSPSADRMIVVPYDKLAGQPGVMLHALYRTLGEPPFDHSFDNVDYQETAFDAQLGTPGLHTVESRVALASRTPSIPPDLFRQYADTSFWNNPQLNPHGACVL